MRNTKHISANTSTIMKTSPSFQCGKLQLTNHTQIHTIILLQQYVVSMLYDRNLIIIMSLFSFINRCAETDLNETVSQLLCALLKRLTDLERHEQYLRSCQNVEGEKGDQVSCCLCVFVGGKE